MEFNDIFEYLLLGNLISGKILYELKNTSDITIINDINQLFYNFSLQKKLISLKNNIDSYYISFAEEQLIMISKLKIAFSQEQNSELFETIRNRVPDLIESKYIIKHKYRKRNLYLKITNVIYDYFQYINVDKRIMSFSDYLCAKSSPPSDVGSTMWHVCKKVSHVLAKHEILIVKLCLIGS